MFVDLKGPRAFDHFDHSRSRTAQISFVNVINWPQHWTINHCSLWFWYFNLSTLKFFSFNFFCRLVFHCLFWTPWGGIWLKKHLWKNKWLFLWACTISCVGCISEQQVELLLSVGSVCFNTTSNFWFDLVYINLFFGVKAVVCWSTLSVLMGVTDCNRPLYLLYCSNKSFLKS